MNNNIYNENLVESSSDTYYNNVFGGVNGKQSSQGNGLAIAGMVLGIVSVVILLLMFCCFPFYGAIAAGPFAVVGLILSIVALKKRQTKGMCIAGIICSAIVLVSAIASLILILIIVFGVALTDYSDILNVTSDLFYGLEEMFY